jgi:23S rRNA pseudouridine2605 synthase
MIYNVFNSNKMGLHIIEYFCVMDKKSNDSIRLNKYLSNAGLCSRREADKLIASGKVKVNGEIITEMGFQVGREDKVSFQDKPVLSEKLVYILLNKPKDVVTTMSDPQHRRTVADIVKSACDERVYPVGRLDRSTTGLLLLTNDGELTEQLTHPKYNKKKIYHVTLDKGLEDIHLDQIVNGIMLEDGEIKADEIALLDDSKMNVGIEIHSGRNRIVRRIFEHFGYKVMKLDRVYFAGLTKKNLPRGKYRFLTNQEISMLKTGKYS